MLSSLEKAKYIAEHSSPQKAERDSSPSSSQIISANLDPPQAETATTTTTDTTPQQEPQSQQDILQQIQFLNDVLSGINVSVDTGSEEFLKEAMTLVNHGDISEVLSLQDNMYVHTPPTQPFCASWSFPILTNAFVDYRFKRFQESNATLTGFNEFSASMYSHLWIEFEKNTKMVKEMKKDLDSIFKRIRYVPL